jgi:hypothetical protein
MEGLTFEELKEIRKLIGKEFGNIDPIEEEERFYILSSAYDKISELEESLENLE